MLNNLEYCTGMDKQGFFKIKNFFLLKLVRPEAANLHFKLIRFVNDLNDKRHGNPHSDDEPNLSLWLVHFTCFTSNPSP